MHEDLDVSEVVGAVERVQLNYRKPLPGVRTSSDQPAPTYSVGTQSATKTDSPACETPIERSAGLDNKMARLKARRATPMTDRSRDSDFLVGIVAGPTGTCVLGATGFRIDGIGIENSLDACCVVVGGANAH
jgi:hypothetical protein